MNSIGADGKLLKNYSKSNMNKLSLEKMPDFKDLEL